VRIASKEEEEKKRKSEKLKEGKEYYVKLFLDAEITIPKKASLKDGYRKNFTHGGNGQGCDPLRDVKGMLIKNTKT